MGIKLLTARQQYWLDHLTAAAASNGTLVDYAKTHQTHIQASLPMENAFNRSPKMD